MHDVSSTDMRDVTDFSVEEKVGQLFVVGFDGTEPSEMFRELMADYAVGGVIYFSRNIDTPEQTATLSRDLQALAWETMGVPLLISIDQEGGAVARLPFGGIIPSAMAIGATGNPERAREAAVALSTQLDTLGITMDLAPVLDVNNNPANPVIGVRSFGEDPDAVAEYGKAFVETMQEEGTAACGKHFPGHGDSDVDSHCALPVIDHERTHLDRIELRPFRAAIEAGIDAIMTAHVSFPTVAETDTPATLSERVLTGLLRDELGYDGLVMTDCMEMSAIADSVGTVEGAVQAVRAGADQVLVSHTPECQRAAIEAVIEAVRDDIIPEARIDRSVERILQVKKARCQGDVPGFEDQIGATISDTSERIAREAVTLVCDTDGRVPIDSKQVFVWDVPTGRGAPVEDTRKVVPALITKLENAGFAVRRHTFTDSSHPKVRADETVLFCTQNAAHNDVQAAIGQEAVAADFPLVVTALGSPYDFSVLSNATTYLTTYDSTPASLSALTDVLAGVIEPQGTLPVTIDTR
jgi:beta-N-acetylhexosaminidase